MSGGVNTTCTMQLWLTASVAGQLLVCLNIPLAGTTLMPVIFTGVVPSLTRVALIELLVPTSVLGKVRLLGENEMALTSPTPVSEMVCVGLPGLWSVIVTAPVRVPAAVGVKTTVIVQLFPGIRVPVQVLGPA